VYHRYHPRCYFLHVDVLLLASTMVLEYHTTWSVNLARWKLTTITMVLVEYVHVYVPWYVHVYVHVYGRR
jgi:hypothetical protein